MSKLFDDASLAMIPSAYKDGKLYSIRPTDGSGDFTFSRGSNLAATRVDVNGLIEKGRENLLFPSEGTTTGWSATGIGTNTSSILTGQQDPNGGTQGYRWTATCGATTSDRAWYRKNHTRDGNYLTLSFWIKSANGSNQTISFHYAGGNRSTINVTNEWQRVEYGEATGAGVGYFGAEIRGTITDQSADVYLYGWQLEKSLVATDYIETGASTAQAGILEDLPRLDYSGGASCPSLLLEPQRTNVIPQSEYFGASDWTKANVAVTDNATTSPEGVQNAALVYPSSSSSTKWGVKIEETKTGLTNSAYTNSVYLKANGWRWVYIIDASGLKSVWFDLQEGVVGTEEANATGDIEPMGDGWYRCTIYTHASTTTYAYMGVYFSDADNSYVCTASGTNGVYMYGFQSEAGSYPTSYIPTMGSAVTRGKDSTSLTNASSLIGQTEGTIFIEAKVDTTGQSTNLINVNHSVTRAVVLNQQSNKKLRYQVYASGGVVFSIDSTIISSGFFKAAIVYKSGESALFVNGVKSGFSTNNFTFESGGLNNIYLGAGINYYAAVNKNSTKQALVFPTALTDSECIALTTL
jgi:hypothetical protein